MLPLRELYDFAPEAKPVSVLGFASWPTCSTVFSHGRSSACWKAAPSRLKWCCSCAVSGSEPSMSNKSRCILSWNLGKRCWMMLRTCTSAVDTSCDSLSLLWPCFWRSWTFVRMSMAWPIRESVSFMSASSAKKAFNSSSRTLVAVARASWSSAISAARPAISVLRAPALAEASSRKAVSPSIRSSATSTAAVFSFLFVAHQHMYLS
mmetsp:Transcript_49627/g.137912  ORF Transcript_49627/g.137912 Transcript_49627/m.137912 type:complete len:207 (+) Transcript_49627:1481-2101(+)